MICDFISILILQYLQQEVLPYLQLDHAYHEMCLGEENSELSLSDEVRVDVDTGGGGGGDGGS